MTNDEAVKMITEMRDNGAGVADVLGGVEVIDVDEHLSKEQID